MSLSFFRVIGVVFIFGGAIASSASAASEAPAKSAPKKALPEGDERFRAGLRTFPSNTSLAEIPIYQFQPQLTDGERAVKGLNLEIERLYTHAKTLDSGAERRAFESRIYLLDKRLRPLASSFDLPVWEALRTDVSKEWSAILASFARVDSVPPLTTASIE